MNRKNLLFGSLFVICFVTASTLSSAQSLLPEDPTRGGRLLVTKGCVKCHSLNGEGGRVGPDLGRIDLGDTQLGLASKLINHIPAMTQGMERAKMLKPNLTADELTEISASLYFLKFFDEPGDTTRGKHAFTEKGCNNCHALSGKGKEREPGLNEFPQNLSPVFLAQTIWNHGPVMIAEMVKRGMKWPLFEGTEMMDLLEYIKMNAKGTKEAAFMTPGNPRQGRQVFVAKGCIQCHSVHGEGGKVADDLGKKAKTFYKSLTRIASNMWDKGPTVLARMAQTRTGIPKFTSREMADLIAYLYFLHFVDEPGNPANGRKVFSELGCSKCHRVNGIKGELRQIDLSRYQKTPNPMELVSGIWNHSTEIERAMRENMLPWPRFKNGDLDDLIEFIRTAEK